VTSWASLLLRPQLGNLAGLADEWFELGIRLRTYHTLGPSVDQPSALRAPGYPAFVATVVWAFVESPARLDVEELRRRGAEVVGFAQGLLLATTTSLLFLWLRRRYRERLAFAAAACFGLNPYSIVLVGLLHYDLLHMLGLIAGMYALDHSLQKPSARGMALCGLLWGLVCLVRPVTLVVPGVVWLAVWLRHPEGGRRAALLGTATFTLGLVTAVAPWTVRNLSATGRFVAVNQQARAALWGSTVKPFSADPDRYHWFELYLRHYMPIFHRVTGHPAYDYLAHNEHLFEIDEALGREAVVNLRRQPTVYLRNVARSFLTLNLHVNGVLVQAYEALADGAQASQQWFRVGQPQDFGPRGGRNAVKALFGLLSLLALLGALRALRRRETFLLLPFGVYAIFVLAHTLLYMDLMYYYVKLPFLVIFTAESLEGLEAWRLPLPGRPESISLGALAGAGLALGCALSTAAILWS
jgi:hypothetical protein